MLLEIIPEIYLPIFIFFARILDVSIGTLRIMFVAKGMRIKSTILGFFEVLIWIIIVAQIFQNLNNWLNYVAFAGGFAAGTYIGMLIEEKMQMGIQIFRVITNQDPTFLLEKLRESGFRVTTVHAEGTFGAVRILFMVAKRRRWKELSALMTEHAPNSFYSVEDVKYVSSMEKDLAPTPDLWTRMLKLKKSI
ncbi:MAG: DUF2179 domain-containing protein [Balneolaceae bacterium]